MNVTAGTGQAWTRERILALGMTTDVETAAEIIGIGRSKAYQLAKQNEFPVRIRRIGRRYVVPVRPLLIYLEET